MSDLHSQFRGKVHEIFCELAGKERAEHLRGASLCMHRIGSVVASESHLSKKDAFDVGFHVADWQEDAAFLVALHLCPERFTDAEIAAAVESLLVHVPSHVLAAARLTDSPVNDLLADDDK